MKHNEKSGTDAMTSGTPHSAIHFGGSDNSRENRTGKTSEHPDGLPLVMGANVFKPCESSIVDKIFSNIE